MTINEVLHGARDAATVRRVFGDPVVHGDVVVIPAAAVRGVGGGGDGENAKGERGEGGGFAVTGRPVGAFVIRGDEVFWRPAVDLTRLSALVGVALAVVAVRASRRRRD